MMFLTHLLHRLRSRAARRRSMGFLLVRPDDRLLDDIGLSRADLRALLEQTAEGAPDPRPERAAGRCEAGPCR